MAGVALGDVVAGCRIEDVAGHGGMGVVYRATQLRLNRTVAFKAMAAELALNPAYRERFQREAQLAASIEHPNVIPVYEAGELDSNELYLVMRWVEGTDLRELLDRERRLAPSGTVQLLAPVALALNAAHARGLVHRDVKPANVLIAQGDTDQVDHVYLTDFGIARGPEDEGGLTRTGTFVGTLAYASPERIEGDRGAPASDIYALGCVLFEALAGRPPFNRETELSTMNAHLHDPIPSLRADVPDAPVELDEVVHIALAKSPADRFATAGEMAAALDDALVGRRATRPTDADTASATHDAAVPATSVAHDALGDETVVDVSSGGAGRRRNRGLAIAAGALAVGGVIALVIALAGGGGSRSRSLANATPGVTTGKPHVRVVQVGELSSAPGAVALAGPNAVVTQPARAELTIVYPGGRPASTIAVGSAPSAVAVDQSGRIWVAVSGTGSGSGEVRVIDPATGKTIARIPCAMPSAIAIGGGFAWVADRGSNDVRAIDLNTLKSSGALIPTGGRGPVALAYDQSGTLWVANQDSSDVTAIRARQAGPAQYVAGGPSSITANGSGGVWVGTTSGSVVRLSESGHVTGRPIDLNGGPAIVALVGADLWVLARDAAMLSLMTTSGARAGTIVSSTSMAPAEAPAAMACAPHRCVVTDPPTRGIVAAMF
jgi:serine/threonine-protein kinase